MTTRIQAGGPSPFVSAGPTAARTTVTPARPFQQLVRASSNAIVTGAEQAMVRLPGAPILAAAVRPVPGEVSAGSGTAPEGARSALSQGSGLPTSSSSVGTGSAGAGSIEGVLSENADQNLYYLQLQERISQENRTFTAMSNVLKARHETVKNAITNIR